MTTNTVKAAPERKQRRKGDIARNNIIAAARELFAERGYARTTTRDIATRAQSSEVLLFRYFSNKANLFREAVVNPFDGFLKAFLEAQISTKGPGPFAGSEDFVGQLFTVVSENRDIFFTLISTHLYEAGAPEEQVNAGDFKEYFRVAVDRIEAELNELGVTPVISPDISSRLSFTAVVATGLFHGWIFAGTKVTPSKVVAALNAFIIAGMTGLPALSAAGSDEVLNKSAASKDNAPSGTKRTRTKQLMASDDAGNIRKTGKN